MRFRLVLLCAVLFPMSAALAADIGLSPPRIELTLPRGGTATEVVSLIASNGSREDLTVSKGDWTQDVSGKVSFLPSGEGSYSATPWLTLSANSVSVPADGQVGYRFNVTVPTDAKLEGTYHTVLFFETRPSAPTGSGSSIRVQQRVGLILYVTIAGTQQNGSRLTDMYADGSTIHAIVTNVGNTLMRYSGTVEIRDVSGDTVKSVSLRGGPILRDSERDIAVKMSGLAKGYYVLLLLLKDSRGGLLTGQLPYEVK